jgi:pyrroloquinoline-quinone synthase
VSEAAWSGAEFVERLRTEGARRYHDHHPFHVAMHAGTLTREQLQAWVRNRFYYQSRIPIKDALILAKSEDPEFRRRWIRRIHDHDGSQPGEGGLALWLRLASGVGLDPDEVASLRDVLPGVRFACDGYLQLVRERSLLEAVASSLTEFFAPDLMSRRIAAWEKHYPWVQPELLAYFRARVPRAKTDSEEAIEFVVANAASRHQQQLCVDALIRKTEILWALLDCVTVAYAPELLTGGGAGSGERAVSQPTAAGGGPGSR